MRYSRTSLCVNSSSSPYYIHSSTLKGKSKVLAEFCRSTRILFQSRMTILIVNPDLGFSISLSPHRSFFMFPFRTICWPPTRQTPPGGVAYMHHVHVQLTADCVSFLCYAGMFRFYSTSSKLTLSFHNERRLTGTLLLLPQYIT